MLNDFSITSVTYRPVIGFASNCTICNGVVLRYGPSVTCKPGDARKGMPEALIPPTSELCSGHAIYLP